MISDTWSFWSLARNSLLEKESTRRLAMGVALGMVIGLIPKDSLLAYLTICLVMFTTANLACALVSAFVFNWVGFLLDSLTHKLGGMILTHHRLEPLWAWLYEIPVVPWTRFNNTVVMGSLVVSLLLLYPCYHLSFQFFHHFGATLHQRLQRTFWYRWLVAPLPPPEAFHETKQVSA